MKNFIISVFLFFVFLLFSLELKAQGYNVKVNVRDLQFDSLYLQSFDTGGNLVNVVKLPAAKMMEIKGKKISEPRNVCAEDRQQYRDRNSDFRFKIAEFYGPV